MAKRELIPTKQEKAHERIKTFRAELLDYRQYFDRLKKDREDTVRALLSRDPLFFRVAPMSPNNKIPWIREADTTIPLVLSK